MAVGPELRLFSHSRCDSILYPADCVGRTPLSFPEGNLWALPTAILYTLVSFTQAASFPKSPAAMG